MGGDEEAKRQSRLAKDMAGSSNLNMAMRPGDRRRKEGKKKVPEIGSEILFYLLVYGLTLFGR